MKYEFVPFIWRAFYTFPCLQSVNETADLPAGVRVICMR